MILHTLNYTTIDISQQTLDFDNFGIIGKFKVIKSGSNSNISNHPLEGFQVPFLFENYDSFQIIHYQERYYFRVKDSTNNWLSWQRHKHKVADIDGLQTTLDNFNNRITALENNIIGLPPGVILLVAWNPSYLVGKKVIPLNGQGIKIDDYQDLVNATYVGDSLNSTAHFFYKYNSSDGSRNINGDYFKLPDTKALVPKGRGDLGVGAIYFGGNVKNNSNIMGNLQEDAVEDHAHWRLTSHDFETILYGATGIYGFVIYNTSISNITNPTTTSYMSLGRINTHTRDSSFAVDFVITY
jgi:hypothetical protein